MGAELGAEVDAELDTELDVEVGVVTVLSLQQLLVGVDAIGW